MQALLAAVAEYVAFQERAEGLTDFDELLEAAEVTEKLAARVREEALHGSKQGERETRQPKRAARVGQRSVNCAARLENQT